jgi:elongation factor G
LTRTLSIHVVEKEIPEDLLPLAKEKRQELVETVADVDDEIGDLVLMEEEPTNEQLEQGIRRATIACKFSPVFIGSAVKNTGVQPLLDGVTMYLPRPDEKEVLAHDTNLPANAPQVPLYPAAQAPLVGLAFKLEEGKYGQLTYMRIYQGTLKKGSWIFNARTGKKIKVPRLVRMHSDEMEVTLTTAIIHFVLIASRMLIASGLVKSVPSLEWSVPLGIPSQTDHPLIQW